ncbi:AgmX/PglI C-terminal domain-containing protein [Marinobacter alkaliphilus]|uniref:AgmX/PglI C-terminal domain-containing protein n=1 Tax=Marinobacter alkaliphilus TaxID=254719 RepID=A0ABZ3E7K3_9GAMM
MAERKPSTQISRLPWSSDGRESARFGVILAVVVALFLVPALIIPNLHVPERERSEAERIPPRLAQLVEAPKPVVVEVPEPEPEPEPVVADPEPRPETRVSTPPEQTIEQARENAARSGLFAMKDRLAALRAPEPSARPENRTANIGDAEAEVQQPIDDRSRVLAGSGGVQSREGPAREVALAEQSMQTVSAPREVAVAPATPARPSVGERAMSNIRQVFDTQKSVLYGLYQRELRQDPTLEGKVTLELVIEPDGSVSACQVVSSELGNPALEQRIAMRVQMFNFGADNVETRKVRFPIDFLPG